VGEKRDGGGGSGRMEAFLTYSPTGSRASFQSNEDKANWGGGEGVVWKGL